MHHKRTKPKMNLAVSRQAVSREEIISDAG